MSFQDIVNYIDADNKAKSRNGRGEFVDQTDHYVCDALNGMCVQTARALLHNLKEQTPFHDRIVAEQIRILLANTYADSAEQHAQEVRDRNWFNDNRARADREDEARAGL